MNGTPVDIRCEAQARLALLARLVRENAQHGGGDLDAVESISLANLLDEIASALLRADECEAAPCS
jgi:hypothetical protein